MKKYMKNVNNNRVFDMDTEMLKRNSKIFVKCDEDGNVEGEKLAKTNNVLETALDTAEALVVDLKKDIIKLKQDVQDANKSLEDVSIELAGTKSKYSDVIKLNSELETEVKELKELISAKPKKKKK